MSQDAQPTTLDEAWADFDEKDLYAEDSALDPGGDVEADDDVEDQDDSEDGVGFGLAPDELAAINSTPALKKLRKALVKQHNKKALDAGVGASLLKQLKKDPEGLLRQIAEANGFEVRGGSKKKAEAKPDPMSEARKKLEAEVGPDGAKAVDEYLAQAVGPLKGRLDGIDGEKAHASDVKRFKAAEATFRERHPDITKEEMKALIKLGDSGDIPPNPNADPVEYLEDLLAVARRRMAQKPKPKKKTRKKKAGTKGDVLAAKNVSEAIDIAFRETRG